ARTGSASGCRGIPTRGRSWLSPLARQVPVDRLRRQLAVLHGRDRQVPAPGGASGAGPDTVGRGLPVRVHRDAPVGDLEHRGGRAQPVPVQLLADRLEYDVRIEREGLARSLEPPVAGDARILELDARDVIGADQAHRSRPVLDAHAVALRELLLVAAGAHVLAAAAIDDGHVLGAEPL